MLGRRHRHGALDEHVAAALARRQRRLARVEAGPLGVVARLRRQVVTDHSGERALVRDLVPRRRVELRERLGLDHRVVLTAQQRERLGVGEAGVGGLRGGDLGRVGASPAAPAAAGRRAPGRRPFPAARRPRTDRASTGSRPPRGRGVRRRRRPGTSKRLAARKPPPGVEELLDMFIPLRPRAACLCRDYRLRDYSRYALSSSSAALGVLVKGPSVSPPPHGRGPSRRLSSSPPKAPTSRDRSGASQPSDSRGR